MRLSVNHRSCAVVTAALCISFGATDLYAGPDIDGGVDFVTVGAPNNVPFPGALGTGDFAGRGVVPYSFRVSRTEITITQYLSFLHAYAPFSPFEPSDVALTGTFIYGSGTPDNPTFQVYPGYENVPANMSIRMAARFANWMHNGRVSEASAFESGVYDASTFYETRLPNGQLVYHDDYARAPGARFWIPSLDEWLKAVYHDPDKNGAGEQGWWLYPNGTDSPLVVGPPGVGGSQTNASGEGAWDVSAGQYPGVLSPWGVLDASGGVAEFTDDRWAFGSSMFDGAVTVPFLDLAGQHRGLHAGDWVNLYGLRLAAQIPPPSTGVVAFLMVMVACARRRG